MQSCKSHCTEASRVSHVLVCLCDPHSQLLQKSMGPTWRLAAVLAGCWFLKRVGVQSLLRSPSSSQGKGEMRSVGLLSEDAEGSRGRGKRQQGRRDLSSDQRLMLAFEHADMCAKVRLLCVTGTA